MIKISPYKKQLSHSQNFIRDSKLVVKLIESSGINSNDIVYEIGAGKGIITWQLARYCAKVVAIEYDQRLFEKLNRVFQDKKNVKIIFADFLKIELPYKERYKVFSNIPFNLTADILFKLTSVSNPPEDSYLIIQEEVAKKYAGSPYGEERFRSLILKPCFELTILYYFRRTDFSPVPKVSIVLFQIKKLEKPLIVAKEKRTYDDFIAYAFSQHGRNLKERMKKVFTNEQFRRQAQALKFSLSARPGELNFEQWLGLFRYFLQGVSLDKQGLIRGSYSQLISQQRKLDKIHRTRNDRKKKTTK